MVGGGQCKSGEEAKVMGSIVELLEGVRMENQPLVLAWALGWAVV